MAGRPSPTQMASAMTRQKTAYRYSIDQCDVCDKAALVEFREKRLLWLDWLNDDDVHAIWPQISSALWNDIAFRTIANMAEGFPDSALHNSVLTEALLQGYFSVQVLTIRRLFDRRSDVISLRRLIKEIDNNLHLFTRENYVAHDGLPYDYETVERQKMLEILAAGGGAFWAEREGPKAYTPAKMLHSAFDKISGSSGGTRNRADRMSPKVTAALGWWLDESGADQIVTWSHKMLAHAADSASRGQVKLDEIGPNLEKVAKVHRAFVRVTEALGAYVLADSAHGTAVPVPLFNQFEKLHGAVLKEDQVPALREFWYGLSKERDAWLDEARDALTASLSEP